VTQLVVILTYLICTCSIKRLSLYTEQRLVEYTQRVVIETILAALIDVH